MMYTPLSISLSLSLSLSLLSPASPFHALCRPQNLTAVNSTIVNTTAAFVKKVQNSTTAVKKVQDSIKKT